MSEKRPTQGNGPARVLFGVVGTLLIVGGIGAVYFAVTKGPFAFLAATPALLLIGYGTNVLFACGYYDEVIIKPGPLGFPIVTGRKSR